MLDQQYEVLSHVPPPAPASSSQKVKSMESSASKVSPQPNAHVTPKLRVQDRAWAAKASFNSMISSWSKLSPARFKASFVAFTGPIP